MNIKLNNSNELSEHKHLLNNKESELEELKHKHFVVTQERINELVREKSELRDTFEDSLRKLRNAHDQDVIEKKERISSQKNLTYDSVEEIRKMRLESESRMQEITSEIYTLQDTLKSGRRLNDLQIEDNNRLKIELNALKKENDMLCKEVSI